MHFKPIARFFSVCQGYRNKGRIPGNSQFLGMDTAIQQSQFTESNEGDVQGWEKQANKLVELKYKNYEA